MKNRLNDVFPEWYAGGGIFSELDNLSVPWKDKDIAVSLDFEYHGNISGEKLISPLVDKLREGTTWTDTDREVLATLIFAMNGENWEKEYVTLSAEYNPIENYSMTETMTDDETVIAYGRTNTRTDNLSHAKTGTETTVTDGTHTRTDALTHAKTGTETRTDNLTETVTPNLTTGNENAIYGFDSDEAVPTGESTETATGTNTTTHTGTQTMGYSISETDTGTEANDIDDTVTLTHAVTDTDTGTETDAESGQDTHTRNYTLSRSGNIGVTTSQQMLQSERDLWLWNFFREVVFPDIDRVLTLKVY